MFINDEIKIGCDPELFVRDTSTNRVISAHGMLQGDKYNPEFVEKGALQIDGMALEFNIFPASNLKEFMDNVKCTLQELEGRIKAINPSFVFEISPVADFSPDYLDTVPAEAKVLGCTPDYNAYSGQMNKIPDSTQLMRTASGHVHIGWTEGVDTEEQTHFEDCRNVVRQLDCTLLNCSYLWDKDNRRRKMYGAKGAFRPKPYGVEYRVLSNQWLISEPLMAWVYQATIRSMELLGDGINLWKNPVFQVQSPDYIHRVLVRDYAFPRLPGIKIPVLQ